jgi:triosephosphate isomerase
MGEITPENSVTVLVCPPFVNIPKVAELTANSKIKVGSQNCYHEKKGAFTGEISIEMLKTIGCEYIIIGHSERRAIFNETNELINKKLLAILTESITPILCIGETLEERKSGNTFKVLEEQLNGCLQGVDNSSTNSSIDKIVIAYERVWAIGTGVSATVTEIAEAHKWLREFLVEKFGANANDVFLLYGGSLSDANAKETLSIANVDGGLIGGASSISEKFLSILETCLDYTKSNAV